MSTSNGPFWSFHRILHIDFKKLRNDFGRINWRTAFGPL